MTSLLLGYARVNLFKGIRLMEKLNEIIDILIDRGFIASEDVEFKKLNSGTTNGILYTLSHNKVPIYVLKIEQPEIISATMDFLLTYKAVELLPNVLYTDEKKEFILYSYIAGETHFNRGPKIEWMRILIEELFNKYQKAENGSSWGRVNGTPRNSWADFNLSSLKYARENIGDFFSSAEHKRVERLVKKLNSYVEQEEKYYLHGDMGVHNFVYKDHQLNGIIDPSPLIGPKIYDFTYAFCSSPDNLNLSTLLLLVSLMNQENPIQKEKIIEEVTFQLYTRIGICIKVHPHDLDDYLEAWKEWREYLPSN